MTTGQRIQHARKQAKLTQAELGARLGVSGSMIGQYENGFRNPKIETLERISDALGVPLVDLMDISPEEKEEMEDIAERAARDGRVTKEAVMRFQLEEKLNPSPAQILNDIEDAADAAIVDQYASISDAQLRKMCEEALQYLNRLGRIEAARRLDELSEIPKYQK